MASPDAPEQGGTRDGTGSADHDVPYAGYSPFHFNTRQMLRLLLLRSEVLDGKLGRGRFAQEFRRRPKRAPPASAETTDRTPRAP